MADVDQDQDDPSVLSLRGVSAGYGDTLALQEFDLTLRAGHLCGLVGRNGAGKTTLLRVIAGLKARRSGQLALCGLQLEDDSARYRSHLGFAVPPEDLPSGLTGRQVLELVASARNVEWNSWPGECDLVAELEMEAFLDRRIRAYSHGTRQKLSIMCSLLGTPSLLILDESLNGIDPVILARLKAYFRMLVENLRIAVLLSTHSFELISEISNLICFIHEGRRTEMLTEPQLERLWAHPARLQEIMMRALG